MSTSLELIHCKSFQITAGIALVLNRKKKHELGFVFQCFFEENQCVQSLFLDLILLTPKIILKPNYNFVQFHIFAVL